MIKLTDTTKPEDVRPAQVKPSKDTGHMSYTGRAELIRALVDQRYPHTLELKGEDHKAKMREIWAIVKARFPFHASPAHVCHAIDAYRASCAKKAAKAAQQTVVAASAEPAKGKTRAVKKTTGKRAKNLKPARKPSAKDLAGVPVAASAEPAPKSKRAKRQSVKAASQEAPAQSASALSARDAVLAKLQAA